MLTLLLGTNWTYNREQILSMLAQDVSAEKSGRIWMVPELISHQTERDLAACAGDTASRFAEVLSFSRLAKRVSEDCKVIIPECLDNGGRIVAMAAATRQLHSKLKAYAAVETKPEFLTGLLDAVDEFKRCCITPTDLMKASKQTEGSLAQKLEELSLIMESYNEVCSRGKRDPRDQMTWLLEQLEDCDFAGNHVFYFDAFPDFSKQHMDIMHHIISFSPKVVIALNCDAPNSDCIAYEKASITASELISFAIRNQIPYDVQYLKGEENAIQMVSDSLLQGQIKEGFAYDCLKLYHADSVYEECTLALENIISKVQSGVRYRDIHIVCPDLQTYEGPLRTILNRGHIPVYLSGNDDILEKTVIHTVLTALDAALSGFSTKDVLRYMKSMLSPVNPDMCDKLENYAIIWSIEGNRWLQPWQNHPRGLEDNWTERDRSNLQALNEVKDRALAPLVRLRDSFREGICVPEQVQALYQFLSDIKLNQRLYKLADAMDAKGDNRNAQILNQLWEILLGALEQMHDVLTDINWSAENFTRLLKLLLKQYDVGTIPTVLDAVTVGSLSAIRCQRGDHLLVLGLSEGAFPSYASFAGVLNDQERALLMSLGVSLNPGAIDGLQTQFSEIQEVFCGADKTITVSYSGGQPSFVYNRLKKMAGKESPVTAQYGAALTDPWEAAAYLAVHQGGQQAAYLGVSEQYDTIVQSCKHELGAIREETVRKLYGDKLYLSASQIDRVAECKLSYFLKYGMKAKERNAAQIDPAEFGTYVHAVLEEVGRSVMSQGGFKKVSLENTLELASEVSAQYFVNRFSQISTERLNYHFQKNSNEVQKIVEELWHEMQESSFEAFAFELGFGDNEVMPAVPIAGSKIDAQLGGYVDRVDQWNCNGTAYVRVVDYKTGKKDFDYCDVFNGIGLQMLLYLYALEDGGEDLFGQTPIVAGVQYFPARVPLVSADGSLSEEEAKEAHRKDMKRKGLILADEDVLFAMEESENPKRLSVKRKKDGTVSGDIASSHQFHLLKKYIYHLLRDIVDSIASGDVTPNPYTRGSSHDACRFCPYGAVCHPADVEGRRNYQAMSSERFWLEIEKEAKTNG